MNNPGAALLEVRRFEEAITACQDAAAAYRETGDRHGEGRALNNLGIAQREVRRSEEAITRMIWGGAGWDVIRGRVSASFGSSLVLLNDAGGDAPTGADRDALVLRPRPDIAAALPAGCSPPRPAALSPARPAGVIDERCELAAERRGVLGAQIELILVAIHPEPHRRICRAPIKIILEFDGYLLCHPRPPSRDRLSAPYKINCPAA